ncbi:cupin [Oceanicoccus sp. KOV_DT_Chl]|uniref:cupin n=1 Tax=Oceanicoccus sp. KOV_DT_Chl TaxID=1904639 RepID=UPI0011AF0B27|nr:cupin [Oceanicoccus sp. KOV_DT_Chl]
MIEAKTSSPFQTFQISPDNPQQFSTYSSSAFRHNLHKDPLMSLQSIEGLAEHLMKKGLCKFIHPDTAIDSAFNHQQTPVDGRSLSEVFRRIEEPGSWIALYQIEEHPSYKKLLDQLVESFKPLVEPEQTGICHVAGFMFVSAPPSVTPFHIDRENNFWMQVKGRKTLTVFDHTDREVVSGPDVEDFIISGSLGNVRLQDKFLDRGKSFNVGPGDGIYFPSTSPHMSESKPDWVNDNDGVSISLGVVFYTDQTRRAARIHQCNKLLRKFGLRPGFPQTRGWSQAVKSLIGWGFVMFRSVFRGYNPPRGSY